MSNKKHIRDALLCFKIELKSTQYTFFVPLGVQWIVLPLLVGVIYRHYGWGDELYSWIIRLYQVFTPILSVWCPLVISGEYVEGDGHELLYVYRKSMITMYLGFFILSCFVLAVPFVPYTIMYSNMLWEYIRIVLEIFFYFGASYMLLYGLRSVPITFMGIIVYTLISTYFGNGGRNFLIYFDMLSMSEELMKKVYLPFGLIGLTFWICGYVYNNHTEKVIQ